MCLSLCMRVYVSVFMRECGVSVFMRECVCLSV